MDKIEEFINRRFPVDCNWTDGNCFYFALILTRRFPHLSIYYLPIEGHFVASDGKEYFYDWTGKNLIDSARMVKFSRIKIDDPLWYSHLLRDCVL